MKLTDTSFKEKKPKKAVGGGGHEMATFFHNMYLLDLWNFLLQDVNTKKGSKRQVDKSMKK